MTHYDVYTHFFLDIKLLTVAAASLLLAHSSEFLFESSLSSPLYALTLSDRDGSRCSLIRASTDSLRASASSTRASGTSSGPLFIAVLRRLSSVDFLTSFPCLGALSHFTAASFSTVCGATCVSFLVLMSLPFSRPPRANTLRFYTYILEELHVRTEKYADVL